MKVKEKHLDDDFVQLNVTATADEVNRAFDRVEQAFARNLNIAPDPNKTAGQAIAEKLGINNVDSVIEPQVLDDLAPFAIDARNLFPASKPETSAQGQLKRDNAISFTVRFKEKQHYELSSYDPVDITVPRFAFDDDLIDQQINQMLEQYPEFVDDDPHPVRENDDVYISLQASLDGEKIDNLCTDGRTLSLGKGYMPEDFEKNLIGMEVGEEKSFTFEGPNLNTPNMDTATYECTVKIIKIQKQVTPELTDEWVQRTIPYFKDVEDLRQNIGNSVQKQSREQYDTQVANVAQAQLSERLVGSIPDEAYELTAKSIDNTLRQQLSQQGKDFDEFVEEQGGEQQYNIGIMMQARTTLRCDYALDALYDHAGLSITDEDILAACRDLNPYNPMQFRKQMESTGRGFAIREVAQRYAASKYLVEHANITYSDD